MQILKLTAGDRLELKKPHPCGGSVFRLVRVGGVCRVVCEKCGRKMVYKYGRHGKFLACPGFPECRNTKPVIEKIGVPCPKCGKDLVARRTKKGRRYYSCIDVPNCDYMSWTKPGKKK